MVSKLMKLLLFFPKVINVVVFHLTTEDCRLCLLESPFQQGEMELKFIFRISSISVCETLLIQQHLILI